MPLNNTTLNCHVAPGRQATCRKMGCHSSKKEREATNDLSRCSVPISLCTVQGKRWMCHNVTVILEPLLPTHLFPFSQSPCSMYCHLLHFQHSQCCVTCNIFHLQYRHYLNHSCYHHWCSHQHPSLLITSHPVIPLCPHPHTPHAQVHLSLLLNSASLTEVQTNKTPWG